VDMAPTLRHPNVYFSLARRQLELGKRILRNFRRSLPYSRKSGIHAGFSRVSGLGGRLLRTRRPSRPLELR
jgi:hypothetical protein